MTLQAMLERDEGREYKAYPDPLTKAEPWTIGIGHTGPEVHSGLVWNNDQIDDAFGLDVDEATQGCVDNFPWIETLSEARQAVIVAMAFQMGLPRLLGFTHMLQACASGDFNGASNEMLNSLWAHQTPKRAARMALQLQTGNWI